MNASSLLRETTRHGPFSGQEATSSPSVSHSRAENSLGAPLWAGNAAGEIYTQKSGEERSVHGHDPWNIVADLWKDRV